MSKDDNFLLATLAVHNINEIVEFTEMYKQKYIFSGRVRHQQIKVVEEKQSGYMRER